MLGDTVVGCNPTFGGCGSGCPREEEGRVGAADSDVCSVVGGEVGFADCLAFALKVSSNEAVTTQGHIRIAQPRLCFCFREHFESNDSVAVVLVVTPPLWRVRIDGSCLCRTL